MTKAPPPKLKIAYVIDDSLDKTDGVQQYVLAVGGWMSDRGHEVHYLAGQTKRRDIKHVHSLSRNIPVRFSKNRLSMPLLASRRRIKRLLRREKFDIIHVQVPYSPLMGEQVINLTDKSTAAIGTFHILPYAALERIGNRTLAIWLKRSLKRFDKMISVSTSAAEFAREVYGADSVVIPNAVDYDRFHDAEPYSKYKSGGVNIVFLGRLVPRKGCLTLLKAIVELRRSYEDLPDFRVIVCGKGPLEHKLKKFVHDHDLVDIVEFTGYVTETAKPRYLASADLAVFPSGGGESFGIVLIEALATGRSVVLAGDNPGYRTVMEARPQLLFEATNYRLLAEKIAHYLRARGARQEMTMWGERYGRQFDINTVGRQIEQLYLEQLQAKR